MLREYSDTTKLCLCKIMGGILCLCGAVALFLPYVDNMAAVGVTTLGTGLLGYNKNLAHKNGKLKETL